MTKRTKESKKTEQDAQNFGKLQKGILFIPGPLKDPKPGDFIAFEGGVVRYFPAKLGIIESKRTIYTRLEVDVVGGLKQEEADQSGIMEKVERVKL